MATLTSTITEAVTINGAARGNTITQTYTVNDVYERVVNVPTSQVTLYTTHASVPEGSVFDDDLVEYVRITNLAASNYVTLEITNGGSDEALIRLNAGDSFILGKHDGASTGVCSFNSGVVDAGLHEITHMKATADTAACQVEVFVGSA